MPLLYGSPAIDAGNNNLVPVGVTTDERGEPRFDNGKVDIGAYELQVVITPSFVVNTTADFSDPTDGKTSLREAIASANALPGHTIMFDPTVFSSAQTIALTGIQLELSDTAGTETITGPAAGLTVSGGGLSRVFQVDAGATASISALTITSGDAPAGGGISSAGNLTIENTTITNNHAMDQAQPYGVDGGGVYNSGVLTMNQCQITGNTAGAGSDGEGVYNAGVVTINQSQITGNTAYSGGGLDQAYASGTTVITSSSFSSNVAMLGSGIENDSKMSIVNSTIADNSGPQGTQGGGINDPLGTLLTIVNCTIVGNSYSDIFNELGPSIVIQVANSIISNVVGDIESLGNNLISNSSSGSGFVASDLLNVNPLLGPLRNNGGPTLTAALLPGSPAIDAGSSSIPGVTIPTTDERGAPRPTSGGVDIGAFQDQGYTLAVSSGSPQSSLLNQPFNAPLVALLTEDFANTPLPGATIAFSAPSSGASATLSATSAVTDATGLASIAATANAIPGTYTVIASSTGATPSASFNLTNQTNQVQPSFSGLSSQTVTYGSAVTLTGTLAAGSQVPVGEKVAVTLDGVTHDATIASDGSFSTQFTSAATVLNANPADYTAAYEFTTDGVFLGATSSSQLKVNPAPLIITAVSDTKTYDGTTTSSMIPTYSPLYNGDTVTGLTEVFNSKNVLGAGNSVLTVRGYTINDGNDGKNYTVTTQTATGTITPDPLTVRARSDSIVYGSSLPSLTYTISGFVDGDTSTVVSGAPEDRDDRRIPRECGHLPDHDRAPGP